MGRERFDVDVIVHDAESRKRLRDAADEFFESRGYEPVPTDLADDEDTDPGDG